MPGRGWDTLEWHRGSHQPGTCQGPWHEALALLLVGQELPYAVDAAQPRCGVGPVQPLAQDCTSVLWFCPFITAPLRVLSDEIQRSHLSLLRAKAISMLVEAACPARGTWQRWGWMKWVLSSCHCMYGHLPSGNGAIWAVFALGPGALLVLVLLLFVCLPAVNSLPILQDPGITTILIKPFSGN